MTNLRESTATETSDDGYNFETPFTIQHVQTHLILGPLLRHIKVSPILLFFGFLGLIVELIESGDFFRAIQKTSFNLLFWALFVYLMPFTRQQQAIVIWGSMKFALGMGAFLLMGAGSLSNLDYPLRALLIFLLGVIWMPGLEFIPRLTPHQKYITLGRIALSLLCTYFGIRRDAWND